MQYSVFECDLTTEQLVQLKDEIRQLIDQHTDSVQIYGLDAAAIKRIAVLGLGQVSIQPTYYLPRSGP